MWNSMCWYMYWQIDMSSGMSVDIKPCSFIWQLLAGGVSDGDVDQLPAQIG